MTYILIAACLILATLGYIAFNKQAGDSKEPTTIIEGVHKSTADMETDTVKADYSYAITAHGKINDVIFSLAGIEKKEVDGKMVDHIIFDDDEFKFAKEGDVITLRDKLTIKIVKITNPPHPKIGKVYFDIVQ